MVDLDKKQIDILRKMFFGLSALLIEKALGQITHPIKIKKRKNLFGGRNFKETDLLFENSKDWFSYLSDVIRFSH